MAMVSWMYNPNSPFLWDFNKERIVLLYRVISGIKHCFRYYSVRGKIMFISMALDLKFHRVTQAFLEIEMRHGA